MRRRAGPTGRPWSMVMITLAALVGGLFAPVAAASPGAAPAVSTGNGAPEQWAYGTQQWQNTTTFASTYSYTSSSYYASEVVTTATNTSSSTIQVEGTWTWAYTYAELYCVPNCSAASTLYNITLSEWGTEYSFLNVTSAASVYENGTASAAYGVSNVSYQVASNYSERYSYTYNNSLLYRGVAFDAANSTSFVTFTPALGLVPWNLAPHLDWNSSSAVLSGAGAQSDYLYTFLGYGENTLSEGQALSRYTLASNETLMGRDDGSTTLGNGQNGTAIRLAFQGPYNVSYGLFYAPQSGDLFGGATGNWSVGVLYGTLAYTPHLIVLMQSASGSLRIVGAEASWRSTVSEIGLHTRVATMSGPPGSTGGPSGTTVAQPESVAYATSVARCLTGGCSASVAPPTSATSPLAPSWAIAAAAVLVTGTLVGLAYRMRDRPAGSDRTASRPGSDGRPPSR